VFFVGCSTLDTTRNIKKLIKAEKVYINKKGDVINYKVKVENISNKELFITTKAFTPYTPDGKMCINWKGKKQIDVIYNSYSISDGIDYNTGNNGNYWKRLNPKEFYEFSGNIYVKKCLLGNNESIDDSSLNMSENSIKRVALIFYIGFAKKIVCKTPKYCDRIKENAFEIWFKEGLNLHEDDKGYKTLKLSFEIDKDEKQ